MTSQYHPVQHEFLRHVSGSVIFAFAALLLAGTSEAQVTERVSVATNGAQGDGDSGFVHVALSADGWFVAFSSVATDLVAGDTNSVPDLFVRNRILGTTERVSVDSNGQQADDASSYPSISADGRFVAFESLATNLVPGDTNGVADIFVRDRLNGTTERVSVGSNGLQANNSSDHPSISADGRFVAFTSVATNLVAGDTNAAPDIFVRDRLNGTTERVSLDSGGLQSDGSSDHPSLSGDGRFVAFLSSATNLVTLDTNQLEDVFVRDRQNGTTVRASVDSLGAEANGESGAAAISADGRWASFPSYASNLVAGDTNGDADTFVRDLQSGITERISVATGGAQGALGSYGSSISSDGRFVAFWSNASSLVAGDTNGHWDIFVRDRQAATTERASVDTAGAQSNANSDAPSISADGRFVAFESLATNLVAGDTNGQKDVFVHDRNAGGFTSLCDPGQGSVISCPCGISLSAGLGRGCDNSAGTGGASLTASGIAYISLDSLVFTTGDELPTAPSILIQGDALVANGFAFGQGVRCAGGSLRRMYVKTAVNGSITAPDFSAGDASLSARSALLGAPIQWGVPYYYLVYYRDPIVLGGCPASSAFNSTQTGQVVWWP